MWSEMRGAAPVRARKGPDRAPAGAERPGRHGDCEAADCLHHRLGALPAASEPLGERVVVALVVAEGIHPFQYSAGHGPGSPIAVANTVCGVQSSIGLAADSRPLLITAKRSHSPNSSGR